MNAAHSHPLTEQQIEFRLRTLLGVLNRRLNRLYLILGVSWVFAASVTSAALAEGRSWAWWTAILGGAGGSAAVLAFVGAGIEAGLGWLSAWAFNKSFAPGTPERALALKMLAEMRTFRRKAEAALSAAIESVSPADAVVRSKVDPGGEVQAALASLDGSPPAPAQPLPSATSEPALPVRRSGGSYDYIPLEPRGAEDHSPSPSSGEEPPAHRNTD
jgi:hypothetical protein